MTSVEHEPIATFAARYKARLVNADLSRNHIVGEIRESVPGAWWAQTLVRQERIGPYLTAPDAIAALITQRTTEVLADAVRAQEELVRWQDLTGDIVVLDEYRS